MSFRGSITLPPAQSTFFQSLVEQDQEAAPIRKLAFEKRSDIQAKRTSSKPQDQQSVERLLLLTLARESLKFSSAVLQEIEHNPQEIKGYYSRIMIHPPSWGSTSEARADGKELSIEEQALWIEQALRSAFQAACEQNPNFTLAYSIDTRPIDRRCLVNELFDDRAGYIKDPRVPLMRIDHLPYEYNPDCACTVWFGRKNFKILKHPPVSCPTIVIQQSTPQKSPPSVKTSPEPTPPLMIDTASSPLRLSTASKNRLKRSDTRSVSVATSPAKPNNIGTLRIEPAEESIDLQRRRPVARTLFKEDTQTNKWTFDLTEMVLSILTAFVTGALIMTYTKE